MLFHRLVGMQVSTLWQTKRYGGFLIQYFPSKKVVCECVLRGAFNLQARKMSRGRGIKYRAGKTSQAEARTSKFSSHPLGHICLIETPVKI